MAKIQSGVRPSTRAKPVFAPVNPPAAKAPVKRGDPGIGQKAKKRARSEKVGKGLVGLM